MTVDGAAGSTITVQNNGRNFEFNGILYDQVGGAKLGIVGCNATTAILKNPNNTFTGGLGFENGNVTVSSIGMIGSPSAAGSDGNLKFGSGFGSGTLTVTGTGDFTTDRVIDIVHGFRGPTLMQSGASGLLKFIADLTVSQISSPPLTLQGSTAGEGEFAGKLVDNGTTGTTFVKSGGSGATVLELMSVDGIEVGASVSHTGIPLGTTVSAIDTGAKKITLSAPTTANLANTTITVDGVVNITHLTKNGTGTWTLSGANTHSGVTKISDGILSLANTLALQNSTLDAAGSVNGSAVDGLRTTVEMLTVGGLSGTKNLSALFTTTSGGYSAVTNLTLNPADFKTLSYSGVIADGATGMTLAKTGAGTQTLSGANAYTGDTVIGAGTLALGENDVLPDGSAVTLGAATLDASAYTDTVGTLEVTDAATINLGSGGAMAFAPSSAKTWSGTLTLTGDFVEGASLRFGTTSGGLTPDQMSRITFDGHPMILNKDGYVVISRGMVISIM